MKRPHRESPCAAKGFSPVPLTDQAARGYAPLLTALGEALDGAVTAVGMESPAEGRSGTRLTLQCECTVPVRTFRIGPCNAALGHIVCGVCDAEFAEK
ncbi:hypothetical protein ABT404_19980 [Streptomyces hyaluromycini]|uniref:Uncharacterized protein n=1 Tax=Streptomyces hyaluromycini TaxID=1377993 RepID=A0ABV1WY99_9ACTN